MQDTAERSIPVQAPVERAIGTDEAKRLIAQGEIRKILGLEPIDLRLGLDVARNQLMKGALADAFRTYAALVMCDPSDPELQVGLANCALHLGENSIALQAASAVVSLASSDPRGYYFSGRACLALGHLTEAEEDLTKTVELAAHPKHATVLDEARKFLARVSLLKK
jgi:Flp pilus assembly protein TadD